MKKLKTIIEQLENNILEKYSLTRESLSRELSSELKCSTGVIKRILQGKNIFYPIQIILELLNKSQNKKIFSKKIKENISFIKINSASAKPVKAVHSLTITLSKILGAFMADGSLSIQLIISSPDQNKLKKINLQSIELNLENYIKKGIAKKTGDKFEVELRKHKILGTGDLKNKLVINAKYASDSAIEKVKKSGGEIILPNEKDEE